MAAAPLTTTFIAPSGMSVTIRETNGDDEEILSKIKNNKDNTMLPLYLAGIITDCSAPYKFEDIIKWKVKDKYYAAFKSRLFSIGNILKTKYQFAGEQIPYSFTIDLNDYDWDLSDLTKSVPGPKDPNYFAERITPYPLGAQSIVELTLTSGKKVRYSILTSEGERKALDKPTDEISRTDAMTARSLQWYDGTTWITISKFDIFSSRDMMEIRQDISKNDGKFEMITELISPTGKTEYVPIFSIPDFFYPEEAQL